MLRADVASRRARTRDEILSEFREFQDGELIGGTRYRVVRLIGVGGMGSVYEVEHVELGKRFVLKALLRELARREDLVQRLRNEWRALARLQHTSIVNVTDAGTSESGVPFYVMERLDGETLAAQLKKRRRLHVLEAVNAAAQVLEALSAAHDIGIIHRDVKPANIFLVTGGGLKLLDFGVAKIADATSVVTARGIAVGTPRYMSPEQARGERIDGRSDVYATGLILFEMIAGVGPYDDARDANELLLAHMGREAPLLSSLVIGVAPELERILASMLAKDCRERPAHARVVAEQLRGFGARYGKTPSTDAPTSPANYGSHTVFVGTPNFGVKNELTTRPDGVKAAISTHTDTAITSPLHGQFTTQITTTVNSNDEFITTTGGFAPNTTYVSQPAFDGSTTLEMATLVPAYTQRLDVVSPSAAQAYPPVERPERTEMLGEFTPAMPLDAFPTRTQVPLADALRPTSVTPPPVVDAGRTDEHLAPTRRRAGLTLAFAVGACALLVLAGGWVRHVHSHVAVAAVPALAISNAPAPVVSLITPSAAPMVAAQHSAAEETPPGPVDSAQVPLVLPKTIERTTPASATAKMAQSAPAVAAKPTTSGPFQRAAAAVGAAHPAAKPKLRPEQLGLPASGL